MTKTYETSLDRDAALSSMPMATQSSISAALPDYRSSALVQRKIIDMTERSPRVLQQKMMVESFAASPKMKAPWQPKPVAISSYGNPVQLYKAATKNLKNNGLKFSTENSQYHVSATASNASITANEDAIAPLNSSEANRYEIGEDTMIEYQPDGKFLADCLHTAEEIMHQENLKRGKLQSEAVETGKVFGSARKGARVWDVARGVETKSANTHADPETGDAFAIVAPKPIELEGGMECQYHAAAVVASDGSDRITLEVFGDDRKRRVAEGKYYLYNTDPLSKHTFHDKWKKVFTKNSITISLQAIGKNDGSDDDDDASMAIDEEDSSAATSSSS